MRLEEYSGDCNQKFDQKISINKISCLHRDFNHKFYRKSLHPLLTATYLGFVQCIALRQVFCGFKDAWR